MRLLVPLLLASLLLSGCTTGDPQPTAAPSAEAAVTAPVSGPSVPIAATLLSEQQGAVTVYPLPFDVVESVHAAADRILVFSGDGISTTVTQLSGDPLRAEVSMTLPGMVDLSRIRFTENSLYWYDPQQNRIHTASIPLQNFRSIDAPENLLGDPVFSSDGATLYYCTPTAICALDTASGTSRVIQEAAYSGQTLSGLLMEDTVLALTVTESGSQLRTLFLSADTGRLLAEASGSPTVTTSGTSFYTYQNESTSLFGAVNQPPRLLLPRHMDSSRFLFPVSGRAVTVSATGTRETTLDCYDLVSGLRTAGFTLPEALSPRSFWEDDFGNFWFLAHSPDRNGPALYRWSPAQSPAEDSTLYAADYFTADAPDYDGLAACTAYAQELSAAYGLEILIYKDAAAVEPWDYDLTHEHQSAVLMRELQQLEARLRNFPPILLQTLRDEFSALKICIVRDAVGSADTGSLEAVDGIQFYDGSDAYIVLCAGEDTESALYHELGHLMESVILTRTTAYDHWDSLNPAGFSYDLDYIANRRRDGSPWLQPGRESFIDTYSMSFPAEDRARILEYAMLSGQGEKFASPRMQAKLTCVCSAIREAFHLESYGSPLLWEQYLYN